MLPEMQTSRRILRGGCAVAGGGTDAELKESGLLGYYTGQVSDDGAQIVGAGDDLPWYMFNSRFTFEGLIDIANKSVVGGPRAHLAIDELSICVSVAWQGYLPH